MKQLTQLTLGILVIGFVLSGCSNSNQQAFSKRKYQPWFAKHQVKQLFKNDKAVANTELEAPSQLREELQKVDVQQPEEQVLLASKDNNGLNIKFRHLKAYKPVVKGLKTLSSQLEERTQEHFAIESLDKLHNPLKDSRDEPSDEEVMLLLLVILCFLLPPLAVFLVEGANTIFLISILLTILGWVPGIVFALLVVFDVI